MKPLFFVILLITIFIPLRADEWLTNGDFSDGNHQWYGTAKSPSDFAPPDPMTAADPFTAKGMIIPLHGTWMKECQDFKAKGTNAVVKITYVVSKDADLSRKAEDFENVTHEIEWDHWVPYKSVPPIVRDLPLRSAGPPLPRTRRPT